MISPLVLNQSNANLNQKHTQLYHLVEDNYINVYVAIHQHVASPENQFSLFGCQSRHNSLSVAVAAYRADLPVLCGCSSPHLLADFRLRRT